MEWNTLCTIGDVIRARRDLYLQGGEDALSRDLDWCLYTRGTEAEYCMDTPCILADPPGYDDGRGLFPAFCDEHRMYGELMPETLDEVLFSALEQKRDASEEELPRALNYYADMDAFLQFRGAGLGFPPLPFSLVSCTIEATPQPEKIYIIRRRST